MGFLVFPKKYVHKTHSSYELIKVTQKVVALFAFVLSRVLEWIRALLPVNWSGQVLCLRGFFVCFLFASIVIFERFWLLTFLRSLCLLVASRLAFEICFMAPCLWWESENTHAYFLTSLFSLAPNFYIIIPPLLKHHVGKGGVDLSDQLVQSYQVLRRTRKWWKTLFFSLF